MPPSILKDSSIETTPERARILIVDDELGPRESLKMLLKPFYTIYMAENGEKALQILKKERIDLVTLDLKMPGLGGTEVLREIKMINEDIEVIIITGFGSLKTAMEGIRYGAADYILKPFDIAELISIVNRTLDRKRLHDQIKGFIQQLGAMLGPESVHNDYRGILREQEHLTEKLKEILEGAILEENVPPDQRSAAFARGLAQILEGKASYATCHSKRVAHYSNLIAQSLRLSPKELLDLQLGAYLHDIGMVGIERKIFPKEGLMSQDGEDRLTRHTEIGSELIAPLGLSPDVTYIVRYHHEHHDGTGSPEGLKGDAIPLLARIVAVAEAFDETITARTESRPPSLMQAMKELQEGSGNRFDPQVVEVFLKIITERQEALLPQFIESKARI